MTADVAALRAAYTMARDALQRTIESGRDVPLDELARHSRLIAWARRDWQNAALRARRLDLKRKRA